MNVENEIVTLFQNFADKNAAGEIEEAIKNYIVDNKIISLDENSLKLMLDSVAEGYELADADTAESTIKVTLLDSKHLEVRVGTEVEKVTICEKEDKVEEDPDTNKLIKGVLIAGGLVLLGIIIGKKTGRYKRWKGNYSIEKPFGMDDDDISAINWFVNKQNEAWVKNHLVLAIDKRYKKPSGYRRK